MKMVIVTTDYMVQVRDSVRKHNSHYVTYQFYLCTAWNLCEATQDCMLKGNTIDLIWRNSFRKFVTSNTYFEPYLVVSIILQNSDINI